MTEECLADAHQCVLELIEWGVLGPDAMDCLLLYQNEKYFGPVLLADRFREFRDRYPCGPPDRLGLIPVRSLFLDSHSNKEWVDYGTSTTFSSDSTFRLPIARGGIASWQPRALLEDSDTIFQGRQLVADATVCPFALRDRITEEISRHEYSTESLTQCYVQYTPLIPGATHAACTFADQTWTVSATRTSTMNAHDLKKGHAVALRPPMTRYILPNEVIEREIVSLQEPL